MTADEKEGTDDAPPVPHQALRTTTPGSTPSGGEETVNGAEWHGDVTINAFRSYMPMHQYVFIPTGELWPAISVNSRLPPLQISGKPVRPTDWLDVNRSIDQMTWDPSAPQTIHGRAIQQSGWIDSPGVAVWNLYTPPRNLAGDAREAGPWRDHLRTIYPADADHIERWLAHRVQRPGEKINHALVLGGVQGIGKDTILEPVKAGVGAWNWQDVSPTQMLGRFNAWAKAVVLRISEARDLGEANRFGFYDHSKVYIAAPPDALLVDEKFLRGHYVANVCGVIITTNHKTDGIYLPADDRRHFVAWSEATLDQFDADYWPRLYGWYERGGIGHVVAYLRTLDLGGFYPKAPPPKTPAFWSIVQAGDPPEAGELRDVLDALGSPAVVTLAQIADKATFLCMRSLAEELTDRKQSRAAPHKLGRAGYDVIRNPDADDGYFSVRKRRVAVYGRRGLSIADQLQAVRDLTRSV